MNIKVLNAHLRLLGPAPAGMKWKMVMRGEVIPAGKFVTPSLNKIQDTGIVGQTRNVQKGDGYCEWWYLVPAPRPWRKDPLEITRSILPVEDLRRETVDGIIADFIRTVSDEKTFRAFLKAAKKGLEPQDYD